MTFCDLLSEGECTECTFHEPILTNVMAKIIVEEINSVEKYKPPVIHVIFFCTLAAGVIVKCSHLFMFQLHVERNRKRLHNCTQYKPKINLIENVCYEVCNEQPTYCMKKDEYGILQISKTVIRLYCYSI